MADKGRSAHLGLEQEARLGQRGPGRPCQAAGFHPQSKGKTLQDFNQGVTWFDLHFMAEILNGVADWGGAILPPPHCQRRDIWQRLETFLVVTAWRWRRPWHLVGRGQDAAERPAKCRTAPQQMSRALKLWNSALRWLWLPCEGQTLRMQEWN